MLEIVFGMAAEKNYAYHLANNANGGNGYAKVNDFLTLLDRLELWCHFLQNFVNFVGNLVPEFQSVIANQFLTISKVIAASPGIAQL